MESKIVYVGFAYGHHKGTHGGYHHIKEYVNYDYIVDCQSYQDRLEDAHNHSNLLAKICHLLNGFLFGTAIFPDFLFKCFWLALCHRGLIFHFIYAEGLYLPLASLLRINSKVVCTIHLPVERLRGSSLIKRLGKVHQIIMMGYNDVDEMVKLTNNKHVAFIPHGVDTRFYSPDSHRKKGRMLLTVGNMLRDYQLADRVFGKLSEKYPDLSYVVVAHTVNKQYFSDNNRIIVLSGISDVELRNLYRECDCFFLPVKKYTANNALLEAAAVGCKILIASDYVDESYIPREYINSCPLNDEVCEKNISTMLDDDFSSEAFRDYVQKNLDWIIVGKNTEQLLRSL